MTQDLQVLFGNDSQELFLDLCSVASLPQHCRTQSKQSVLRAAQPCSYRLGAPKPWV